MITQENLELILKGCACISEKSLICQAHQSIINKLK
jgi:hypothetical protein